MAWLKKAKTEETKKSKEENEYAEDVIVEDEEVTTEVIDDEKKPAGKRALPKVHEHEADEAIDQTEQAGQAEQTESAKYYENKPVIQTKMFLPLQPELQELIVTTKQQAQIIVALGNMLNTLVEGQKKQQEALLAQNKLLEQLITIASQGGGDM